ncbi:unnamed protein product [Symbiodinium natans]|uniref:Amino acid transporter transmembrane domain-containing protein n=1 Tax=Symbiodinium natans TaxID=878477 RepID=A0A812SKN9_9DINO|nr:unnamed protein product [Symbiodinium natans]
MAQSDASPSPRDATGVSKDYPKDVLLRTVGASMPELDAAEEAIHSPMEKCRKRLREKRRRIEASLQKAVAENERSRREREAAHEQRLRRIAADNARRRHEEELVLQKAARREVSFLKSLGMLPPPKTRIRRTRKAAEAYATDAAAYLVQLPQEDPTAHIADAGIWHAEQHGPPGCQNFSGLYQQSGWFLPTLLVVVCVLSSILSGALLLAAIRAYPDNQDFDVRVEYGTLCRHYFPRGVSMAFQCLFQLAMLTANVSNIIQTAQVADYFLVDLFGKSCAVELWPEIEWLCEVSHSDITPFGTGKLLISAGMAIVAAFSVPLGYWNLEENVRAQNVALVVIVLSISLWVAIFCALGLEEDRVPAIGSSFDNLGGTVLFNFMYVSTLPSWVCEKKPSVKPMRTILAALLIATVGYILVGALGGMAFEPYFDTDNTLLSELQHISEEAPAVVRTTARWTIQAYAISANLASVPIFCILMRYNLQEGVSLRFPAYAPPFVIPGTDTPSA